MNCIDLLRAVAPARREPQDAIARGIERFLASGSQLRCVNAETGVGKTLGYAVPAALAASRGSRVVVSTHTTQQLDQISKTLLRITDALPTPIAVARRLGRANYLSRGRIARVLANRDDMDGEARAQLTAAREHAGLIDDFERDNGPLPLPHSDLCLTSSCTDQQAYDAQRVRTGQAAIVVQTHAMSVLDAVRGCVDADVVIYDEADALPSAAAGFAEARVSPLDLAAVQERHAPPGLAGAVDAFEAWAERTLDGGKVAFKQNASGAVRHARAIRAALAGLDAEHARDLHRALGAFIKLDTDAWYRGAAVVATEGGHAFEVLALDPGRILRRTCDGRKTLFVSATLAVGSNDFEPFLRSVGADRLPGIHDPLRADMHDFGSMAFSLAERGIPAPFTDGERDPAFDDYAASVVRRAMTEGGRVLALVPSFADVEEMARRIGGIIAHRRGERLAVHLETLESSPNGVLVTPSAWAGTDLPGLLGHVVIVRIPFPPPNAGRTELLRRLLQAKGYDGNAEGILRARDRRDALRRLAQGLGRGIRTPDDRVKVWIADPRFPLPDTLARNPRLLLSQGLAARNRDLSGAIPRRFVHAYESANVIGHTPDANADGGT